VGSNADASGDSTGTASDAGSGGESGTGGAVDAGPHGDSGAADAGVLLDGSEAGPGRSQSVTMTFYGWPDNSPPGNAIAYPKSGGFPTIHDGAGGTGTYAEPITFATDQAELPVGTLLYAAVIEKYLIMEDDCVECDSDWSSTMKWHVDVWMNSNASASSSAVLACENQWTQTSTTVEINPPAGRAVTTPPLFDTTTDVCRTSP
jgi:hypothetical protein